LIQEGKENEATGGKGEKIIITSTTTGAAGLVDRTEVVGGPGQYIICPSVILHIT
jgi:hypothetical protein